MFYREPCCGTHVINTADIEDFCIISVKSLGRSTTSISAVTDDRAKLARSNAAELVEEIDALTKNIGDNIDKVRKNLKLYILNKYLYLIFKCILCR